MHSLLPIEVSVMFVLGYSRLGLLKWTGLLRGKKSDPRPFVQKLLISILSAALRKAF